MTKQQQTLFIAMHFERIHFSLNISSPPVIFEIGRRGFKVIIEWYGYKITVVDNNISVTVFNSFMENTDKWWKEAF